MKTVRFAKVVEQCGEPVHHLTFSAPAKDPALVKAAAQNRVLTVQQEVRGSKKDSGIVGFEIVRHAQYFIFPKSLRPFAGARVEAIKYELAGESLSFAAAPAHVPRPKSLKKSAQKRSAPAEVDTATFAPTPPPAPVPVLVPPPQPISRQEIKHEVRHVLRDLRSNKTAAAALRLNSLADRLAQPAGESD